MVLCLKSIGFLHCNHLVLCGVVRLLAEAAELVLPFLQRAKLGAKSHVRPCELPLVCVCVQGGIF